MLADAVTLELDAADGRRDWVEPTGDERVDTVGDCDLGIDALVSLVLGAGSPRERVELVVDDDPVEITLDVVSVGGCGDDTLVDSLVLSPAETGNVDETAGDICRKVESGAETATALVSVSEAVSEVGSCSVGDGSDDDHLDSTDVRLPVSKVGCEVRDCCTTSDGGDDIADDDDGERHNNSFRRSLNPSVEDSESDGSPDDESPCDAAATDIVSFVRLEAVVNEEVTSDERVDVAFEVKPGPALWGEEVSSEDDIIGVSVVDVTFDGKNPANVVAWPLVDDESDETVDPV